MNLIYQEMRDFRTSTQSARFVALLTLAIGLFQHGAHAQERTASDILKKVAERYGGVSSLSVVAEKKVDLDTDPSDKKYIYPDPSAIYAGSHEDHEIQLTLVVSSASHAKLVLKNGKKEILVVRNSKTIWTSIPAQHSYTQVIETRPSTVLVLGDDHTSGANLLREYEVLVLSPFQSVAIGDSWGAPTDDSWAKLANSETLKLGRDTKECYVLTRKSQGSKNELWVDKTEFNCLEERGYREEGRHRPEQHVRSRRQPTNDSDHDHKAIDSQPVTEWKRSCFHTAS